LDCIPNKEYPPKEFAEYQGKTLEEEKAAEHTGFFKTLFSMPKVMGQLAVFSFSLGLHCL
jgi:hypothetical protein